MSNFESREILPYWRSEGTNIVNQYEIPDYGNTGVAVDFTNGVISIKNTKLNCSPLAAKQSCMPFLPPNQSGLSQNCIPELSELNTSRWKKKMSLYQKTLKKDSKARQNLKDLLQYLRNDLRENEQRTIDVPDRIYKLAREMPTISLSVGDISDDYLHNGGNLFYLPGADEDAKCSLIYSAGENMNKLVFQPVRKNTQEDNEEFLIPENDYISERLFPTRIYQVEALRMREKTFCGVRFSKRMEFGILSETIDGGITSEFIKTAVDNSQISHFAMSPYIPGDYLYITASGDFTSCNMESSCTKCPTSRISHGPAERWCIQYSSHPRCFVSCCRSDIVYKDLRTNRASVSLLNANHSFLYDGEELCTFNTSCQRYLHYIGSTRSLILLDERYPGHPVLHWKHQMNSPPVLMSRSKFSTELFDSSEAVVLASRKSQELVLFNIQHQSASKCVSLSPPLHISRSGDFIDNMLLSNVGVDQLVRMRTQVPLDGLTCVPIESKGLTVLQMTSIGDIFYQNFYDNSHEKLNEKSHRCGPGYTMREFEPEVLARLKRWTDDAFNTMIANTSSSSNSEFEVDATSIFESLLSLKSHSHNCNICCVCKKTSQTPLNGDFLCDSCGTNTFFSRKLIELSEEAGVLAGQHSAEEEAEPPILSLEVSFDEIQESDDPLMQKITNEWIQDDDFSMLSITTDKSKNVITKSINNVPDAELTIFNNQNTQNSTELMQTSVDPNYGASLNLGNGVAETLIEPLKLDDSLTQTPNIEQPNSKNVLTEDQNTYSMASYLLEISHDNEFL